MKQLKFLFCFVLGMGFFSLTAQKTLPDVSLKTLEGRPAPILSYTKAHKLTIVSFWATWCAPCKRELDALTELFPTWSNTYDLQVLAVTVDDQRQLPKVRPMVSAQGWPFTILSDVTGQLKNALNFQAIPHSLLVNDKGEILYIHSGYVPGDEVELEKQLKAFSIK